jgi:hypothetical protein
MVDYPNLDERERLFLWQGRDNGEERRIPGRKKPDPWHTASHYLDPRWATGFKLEAFFEEARLSRTERDTR